MLRENTDLVLDQRVKLVPLQYIESLHPWTAREVPVKSF